MSLPILFVGTATLDLIALVDHVPKQDQRIKALGLVRSGGGPAANAAVAARTLGAPCSLITALGDDIAAQDILEEFEARDIGIGGVQLVRDAITPTSLIHVEKSTGLRSITYFGGALKSYKVGEFLIEMVENCSIVHADGNFFDLTLKALQVAKQLGKTTSLDGGNITGDELSKLLPLADIFITDQKSIPAWAASESWEDTCKKFADLGPEIVAITLGKDGCILYNRNQFYRCGGISIDVVDTTGAGDNFHGTYVFGVWKGLAPEECMRLANAFAALSCKGLGGRGYLPSYEEVLVVIGEITEGPR